MRTSVGLVLVVVGGATPIVSCSGDSNSERAAAAGQSAQAGDSNSSAGSSSAGSSTEGGNPSSGQAGSNAGSQSEPGGSGTSTTAGGPSGGSNAGGNCPTKQSWTEAGHYVLQVTWPATLAATSGSGKVEVWSRIEVKATGNDLTGTVTGCGMVLPEATFTAAGQLATGGQKLAIQVPDSVWEGKSVPVTMLTGKQSGFDVGSSVERSSVALQGIKLSDPKAAWPTSSAQLQTFDFDDDTFPGWTATARTGGGYVLPPTAIGLVGSAPSADKVYNVSRAALTDKGKRTACDAHSGPVDVSAFDYHVVGCHVLTGDKQCDPTQTDFLDQNRMVYVTSSATYEAKTIADGASCADVRAAFPQK